MLRFPTIVIASKDNFGIASDILCRFNRLLPDIRVSSFTNGWNEIQNPKKYVPPTAKKYHYVPTKKLKILEIKCQDIT